MFKILAADDHPMILDGISLLLEGEEYFILTAIAKTPGAIPGELNKSKADLLLLDLNMSGTNMIDHIPSILDRFPKLKIVIFSSYNTPRLVKSAFEAGAKGYILKDTTKRELMKVLRVVSEGKRFIGDNVHFSNKGNIDFDYNNELQDNFLNQSELSEREIDVLKEIVNGHTEQEIANILFISKHTVHTHRKNIMKKLNLHSTAEVIKYAYENMIL